MDGVKDFFFFVRIRFVKEQDRRFDDVIHHPVNRVA